MNNYIVGYNPVSFILCFLLDNVKIIDVTPKYNIYDYHLSDLYLKPSADLFSFLSKLEIRYTEESYMAYFGFVNRIGPELPENFVEIYNLYTRGKSFVEDEYQDQINQYIAYVSINNKGPYESYVYLIKQLEKYVLENNLFIEGSLLSIEPGVVVLNDGDSLNYDRLIYTEDIESLDQILKGVSIKDFIFKHYYPEDVLKLNLPLHNKNVYVCENKSEVDLDMAHITHQILYTGKPYFKKTYYGDRIIYEATKKIFKKEIDGNPILYDYETKIVKDNLDLNKICGIDLVGRLAQCYESLTIKDVILRCGKLNEKYYNDKKIKNLSWDS